MSEKYLPTQEQVMQRVRDYTDLGNFEEWVCSVMQRYVNAISIDGADCVWSIEFASDLSSVKTSVRLGMGRYDSEQEVSMPVCFLWMPEELDKMEEAKRDRLRREEQAKRIRIEREEEVKRQEKERSRRKHINKTIAELEAELALKKAELASEG